MVKKNKSEAKSKNEIVDDEMLRANVYSLLGALLAKAPDAALLTILDKITAEDQSDDPMSRAWFCLKEAARSEKEHVLKQEYYELFVGLGRGELVPYGSWYITGYLMEKPLGQLRTDLANLGFSRQDEVHEPEDHVAALCEVMAMLIADKSQYGYETEKNFFTDHVDNWMYRFFSDLMGLTVPDFTGRLGNWVPG